MSYLPRSIVEKNVKTRVRKDRLGKEHTDYEAYFGTDPFTKQAVRVTRSSLESLKKYIKEFYLRHQSGGDAAVRLTAMQSLDAQTAIDALRKANMSISLTDAVSAFLSGSTCARMRSNNDITVGEAYKAFLESRTGSDYDKTNSRVIVGRWAENIGMDTKLADVTAKSVYEYLESHFVRQVRVNAKTGKKYVKEFSPKTYNSYLLYLKIFFNWCVKETQGYLSESPIRNLEERPEPWKEPQYLKATEAEAIMRMLEGIKEQRPDMLAYEIVNLFCGARDVEVFRMAKANSINTVNMEDQTIRIAEGKGSQKGRMPRSFMINETAYAWMNSFDFLGAVKKINGDTKMDIFRMARKNGLRVFRNYGRHTFITMHVAAFGDPAKTQHMVGTSDKMRADNYCGLASRAEGESFFRILPSLEY